MRAWFQRFMAGRYGGDQFGRFLSFAAIVCFLLGLFVWDLLYYVGVALLVYSYVRMFSRNYSVRRRENEWYLGKSANVRQQWAVARERWALRDTYRYFRCPHCRQSIRVPRGRGRISITCPKCSTQFIKKS